MSTPRKIRWRDPIVAALLTALLLPLAACSSSAGAAEPATGATITVTDDVNRQVTIPAKVQRAVVINSYSNEFVNALGAAQRIVGVDKTSQDRLGYLKFRDDQIVAANLKELNYEAIVALKPDVVLIPRNGVWEDAANQLGKFGIPVVVATAWDYKAFHKTVKLLGEVFGEPENATKLTAFYDGIFDLVAKKAKGTKPVKVYWETTEPNLTVLPGSGFHAIIQAANGKNIFEDIAVGKSNDGEATIDPADVVDRNPDVIIHEFEPVATPTGDKKFNDLFSSLTARPGWKAVNAVKNKRVYVSNGWATSAVAKAIGAVYLAKWLHPKELADVDPQSYLRTWVQDFQHTTLTSDADYIRQLP